MMNVIGLIYGLFTKNIISRVLGGLVLSFMGYMTNKLMKELMEPVWTAATIAVT